MSEPGGVRGLSWSSLNPFKGVGRNELPIGRDRATTLYPAGSTITSAEKTGTQYRPSINIMLKDASGKEFTTTLDVSRSGGRQISDVSVSQDGKGITATFLSASNEEESISWQLVAD